MCEKGERQRCSTNISFLQQLSREESNFSIKVIRENYICHKKLVPNRLQNLVESSMHTKCLSLALLTMYMSLTRNILQFRERVPYNLELLLGRQKTHLKFFVWRRAKFCDEKGCNGDYFDLWVIWCVHLLPYDSCLFNIRLNLPWNFIINAFAMLEES